MARLAASGGSIVINAIFTCLNKPDKQCSYLLFADVISRLTEIRFVCGTGDPDRSNVQVFFDTEARMDTECRNNSGQGRQSKGTILPDGFGRSKMAHID